MVLVPDWLQSVLRFLVQICPGPGTDWFSISNFARDNLGFAPKRRQVPKSPVFHRSSPVRASHPVNAEPSVESILSVCCSPQGFGRPPAASLRISIFAGRVEFPPSPADEGSARDLL